MCHFILPELYCPFPSRINPFVREAQAHTDAWVRYFGLHTGQAYETYLSHNLAGMTARFFPTASRERLLLTNDLVTLLFALDDAVDHQHIKPDLIRSRSHMSGFLDDCRQLLREPRRYSLHYGGLPGALWDVWTRLKAISTLAWQEHFIQSLDRLFDAALQEFDDVQQESLPSIAEYYRSRQYLGAAHITTDLIMVTEDLVLPQSLLLHPAIVELTELARNAVCFANDLFSLHKELAQGDRHNLVSIVQSERGLSLQEAVDQAAEIHNYEVLRFIRNSDELPSFGEYDSMLHRYIQLLSCQMRGNLDWSLSDTQRYPVLV